MGVQEHIYSSLLNARTPDVAIRVRGLSWTAIYRLHRVVLTQSGFFDSLFAGGFAESTPAPLLEPINIIFDDANITRSAFEFCLSRLYGGGPPLHIFPTLVPSQSQPLTSVFPFNKVDLHPPTPDGHQPGTPRFLLSLLATSVYLSIPNIAAQALSSVLSSVGPYTVLEYLSFALGKPVGPPDPEWNEPEAAVGLEQIAQLLSDDSFSVETADSASVSKDTATDEPQFLYGPISDKIGEAVSCWLARWAADMLAVEERKCLGPAEETAGQPRRRAKSDATLSSATTQFTGDSAAAPTLWDRGGLSLEWICAVLSSDSLFVPGERERYDLICSVVELRRRNGLIPEEEAVWKTLFKTGIHYCHMSVEDAIFISKHVSPTTKQPFVPISVLQAGHWQSSLLRQHITTRPSTTPSPFEIRSPAAPTPGSPIQREKELGLTRTTAEIRFDPDLDDDTQYYLVPTDSSQRIGDDGSSVHALVSQTSHLSLDDLFTPSFPPSSPALHGGTKLSNPLARVNSGEAYFFGLRTRRYTARDCIAVDPSGTARWTTHPPQRFGVEFWDTEGLPDKDRLYSRTIWSGGSLFNAYVQVVRKKGATQLGIYLHRQSTIEFPAASAPRVRDSATHFRGPSLPQIVVPRPTHYSPTTRATPLRSTTPVAISTSLPNSSASHLAGVTQSVNCQAVAPPPAPYRDSRPAVSAYFTISCASATGASQTRFASAPDVFTVSQSWGWKSSSLRTEEYLDVVQAADLASNIPIRPRYVSLRAVVILGLV
ncbi:unnamed protein product [Mycena citricolor]|uniref:BTB domain-containing protein n=1 Tax=Mycena citricolor TaxID=2018698 RepID=A0AAD2Q633_9AGAR|nr:unnamed protein product [Mycena citricolor]